MRRRIPSVLLLLALVAVDGAGRFAHAAQDHEGVPAGRGPRFLLASAANRSPVHVEPGSNPLLRERITVRLEDVPLEEALDAISREAGLPLVYSAAVVPLDTRVSLVAEGISVGAALAEVLAGLDVDVVISGGQAALVRRVPASTALPEPQEPGTIVGTVTEAGTGRPIVNAQVKVDGVHRAFTNQQGGFFIARVAPGRRTVSVTALGYGEGVQEVDVPNGGTIAVGFQLEVSPTHLTGLVVTATGERRRVEVGHDITVINVDSIVKNHPVTSVTDILEGRVPGLVVQRTSGAPGDPARIRIRGVSSPRLSNDPIIIVDGVRVYSQHSDARAANLAGGGYAAPSPLDYIDPHTIETIQVVKGPSAATLYGQDAANGVIVITTKKGKEGPPRWTATMEYGQSRIAGEYPDLYLRFGQQIADDTRVVCPRNNRVLGYTNGACIGDTLVSFQMLNERELSPLSRGTSLGTSVSASGGSGSLTYSLTGSYREEVGVVALPDYEIERYRAERGTAPPEWMRRPQNLTQWSASSRFQARLGATADVALTANLSRTEQQRSSLEQRLGDLMTTYLDRTTGTYYQVSSSGSIQEVSDQVLRDYYERATATATHFTNAVSINWRPYPWLTATTEAGLNVIQRADEIYLPAGFGVGSREGGLLAVGQGTSVLRTANARVFGQVPLTLGFRFQFAAGVQYTSQSIADLSGRVRGLAEGTESMNRAAEILGLGETRDDRATFGWYIEPGISHRSLWLSTGLRFDGGSTFGTRLRLPSFPKLSVSYLISDEPYFPDALRSVFNTLRLRAAYGHAGQQPGPADRLRLYGPAVPEWVDGQFKEAVLLEKVGNTELKPERSQEFEGGFDADLFADRLSISVTAYRKTTKDAILNVPVAPSVYGKGVSQLKNIGVVRNEGVELSLNLEPVRDDLVNWRAQVQVSRNRNVVLKLGPGVQPFYTEYSGNSGLRVAEGYPLFGRWSRPVLGYADVNGDGSLEPNEVILGDSLVYVGTTLPEYTASLHTTVSLFRGALSFSGRLEYKGKWSQRNMLAEQLARFSRAWNDPSNGSLLELLPAVDPTGYTRNQLVGALRLNSLTVRYSVPARIARRLGADGLTVGLTGTNLGLWTDYSGVDPDVNARVTGNSVEDNGVLPMPRVWQIHLRATY